MPLEDAIRYFTETDGALACMSIACGDRERVHTALGGIMRASGQPVAEDSVFDLASLSKLFTAVTAMRLWEKGLLDLDAPVTRYAPQFEKLSNLTVRETLWFEKSLTTQTRIDAQRTAADAERTLFTMEASPHEGARAYSDMHAMVAAYVIEGASGLTAMDAVVQEILEPLKMRETYCAVPASVRSRCVSCDSEHRIERERWYVREGIEPGTAHDPKARAISPDGSRFAGHAGLFSTRGDMIRFCQGLLRGELVQPETLHLMAENHVGRMLPDGNFRHFLGCLCYVRHPVQRHSEVPVYMGAQTIALSGFTGNHLAIDPEHGIFEFYLGSRVMDRLSVLIPENGKEWTDYGLQPDGSGWIDWPDEGLIRSSTEYVHRLVRSSVDFVHRKDEHYHPYIAETLGL